LSFRSIISAAALAVSVCHPAAAGGDVKGADVTAYQHEIAIPAIAQARFPENADRVRQSWEIGYSYSFSDHFKLGAKINLDQPLPGFLEDGVSIESKENLRPSTIGIEGQYVLVKPKDGVPAIAWFTGVDASVNRDETNTVTFGPLITFGDDKLSLTLNPLFASSFGRNSQPGVDFDYAWQIKRALTETADLAIEGFGLIPDFADTPSADFHLHRVGPVLILHGPIFGTSSGKPSMKLAGPAPGNGSSPEAELQMGVLFGMTEATPHLTGKFKLSITW